MLARSIENRHIKGSAPGTLAISAAARDDAAAWCGFAVMLLPVFFTYSGLNTRCSAVNTGVLAASIFVKFVACRAAARPLKDPP